jgi:hypothetical protein
VERPAVEHVGDHGLHSDPRSAVSSPKRSHTAYQLSSPVSVTTRSIGKAGHLPPKFTSTDFRKVSYWRQRGKLGVPNERFISYAGGGSEPYFGWADWNHAQRAEALGHLIEEGSDGSTHSVPAPIPLLAGLQELLPWLVQWHKAAAPRWTSLWDRELDRHGLTEKDVARWQPPAPRRGRPPKAKS